MKKITMLAIAFDVAASVYVLRKVRRAWKNTPKSLPVAYFVPHTITDGESLDEVIVTYNPSLVADSLQVTDVVEELKLMNPFVKEFTAGERIIVPVFKI